MSLFGSVAAETFSAGQHIGQLNSAEIEVDGAPNSLLEESDGLCVIYVKVTWYFGYTYPLAKPGGAWSLIKDSMITCCKENVTRPIGMEYVDVVPL